MAFRGGFPVYVPVWKRQRQAAALIAKLRKSGRDVRPVEIEGRKIATTFWGASWCQNLEAYSDYESRLPRGRTYARNGSILDLQIAEGHVRALVSGSTIYDVDIAIRPLAKKRWDGIKSQCAGKIDSMVELLRGSISSGVMEIVTRQGEGLFPSPKEISLDCSCPDWASMCKHIAAVLYGIGARLDQEPELLFTLRGVEPAEMIATAVADLPGATTAPRGRRLQTDDLSAVFGVDLAGAADGEHEPPPPRAKRARKKPSAAGTKKKSAAKKPAAKPAAKPAKKKRPAAKKPAAKKAVAKKRPAAKKAVAKKKPVRKRSSPRN